MANTSISKRGTAWDIIITHKGFQAGFFHVREGMGWEPENQEHSRQWWWWYEFGRLFAASSYSHRWRVMPALRKNVTPTLIKAVIAARKGAVFPRTDGDWRAE